jgi:hypothetical protein
LAGSGGAIVFIDGLDFFGAEERLTAIDLVREAAKVPGMSVIVTARRNFGTDEPNWLPQEALDKLGRATPVVIDELSASETEELSFAAPQLTALLSENHPARQVARNLFRLSRLANRPSGAPALRTEAEMAEDWWLSADGARDAGHRDRARVLRTLAEQTLAGADHLTVAGMPAAAVEALIASESLRDLHNDRVAFRHDVLREWAAGNLLFSDPAFVGRLPLDRPAPADLARGVEIAARLAIERTPDLERWRSLHAAVTKADVSESWNRAVLLALVRSEIAAETLEKASPSLFEDRAKILRELIRIVMAVESEPAGKYYAALGIDPKKIPAGINIPAGPSWMRLILWLLETGVGVPAAAIPDIVSLYWNWSLVLAGKDPLTPTIVRWFYYWLSEINAPPDMTGGEKRRRRFNGELTSEQISNMAEELRTGFVVLCNHTPDLAAEYLKKSREHPYPDRALSGLLKFRGSLAQAAPKELAELTADYLMPKKEDNEEGDDGGPFREAFGHRDLDFVPASPAQGPFYELLLHAPEHALPLIRRIVEHAVAFRCGGKNFGKNAMTVVFPDGSEKVFAWHQTYGWPRDMGAGPSVVASALMALEAWAHGRIEKGDAVEAVIADVVGQSPAPAAYLLVAVDLLLSHWPASHAAAIPFVACPELLCLDRERVVADNMEIPDTFGLKEISREPVGPVSIESLKARPSRRSSLDRLLDMYSFEEYETDRSTLTELLQKAAARLGQPQNQSDLGDPEFMVLHALNRVDPKNWRETTVQTANGPQEVLEYIAPVAESNHLKPLQDEAEERNANTRMQTSIRIALNDARRSSPAFAAAAVKWAQNVTVTPAEDETAQWMRDEAVVTAAMIATRDGGAELIAEHGRWIRKTFRRAFDGKDDPAHRTRDGLQYNPIAIAFVGTALLLRNRFNIADVWTLLETAGDDNPAAAQGFNYVAAMLAEIDERLPRAVLRCGFSGCVHPSRHWKTSEDDHKARVEEHRKKVAAAIEAEIAWLGGAGEEPGWPAFEPSHTHSRHHRWGTQHRRLRDQEEARPERYTDHQAAALWLGKAAGIFDVAKRPWLRDLVKAYSDWTATANGSDLDDDDDPDRIPDEWNRAYLNLLAHCLPGLPIPEIDEFALRLVLAAPREAFLDMTTRFVRCVDDVYFNDTQIRDEQAVHIRTTLARHLMESRQWKWQCRDMSDSITTHLGPAIAVLLFNDFGHFQPAKCYLLPKGIDRLDPFLSLLKELAENGPFLFMATTLLNLLEVSPRTTHLEVICSAVRSWLVAHPDTSEFWVGQGIGRRVSSVIEVIVALDPRLFAPGQPTRREVDDFTGKLIRMGVSEAHRLEEALRQVR